MKHITKKILGSIGLLAVVAMTITAYNLPSPALAAESTKDTIIVMVAESGSLNILKPEHDSTVTSSEIKVEFNYSHIQEATFTIYKVGGEYSKQIPFTPSEESSSDSFTLILPEEGVYVIEVEYKNASGFIVEGNSVSFTYKIPHPEPEPEPDVPVPNTGAFTGVAGTNISQMDFLLTGLVVFVAVAGFSTYLVLRKNR